MQAALMIVTVGVVMAVVSIVVMIAMAVIVVLVCLVVWLFSHVWLCGAVFGWQLIALCGQFSSARSLVRTR